VLIAVIYERSDSTFEVHVTAEDGDDGETTGEGIDEALEADEGPSPIAPEMKELLWGLGAFLVFLLAMRLFLVPKVKRGMDARYSKIRGQHEQADEATATAEREVADYQEALAGVRAEAVTRIDAARHTLDAERADKLAEVNARIADRRAAAAAQAEEAKAAQRESIEVAVADVAARATELATGRRPDQASVRNVVADVMRTGVGR
jgi:F-type H+-transporting ATPase subunit b